MYPHTLPLTAALAALFASSLLALPAAAQQPRGGFKPGSIAGHTGRQNPATNPRTMTPLRGLTTYGQGSAMPRPGADAISRNPITGAAQVPLHRQLGFERPVNTPRVNPAQQPGTQPGTVERQKGELLRQAEQNAAMREAMKKRQEEVRACVKATGHACQPATTLPVWDIKPAAHAAAGGSTAGK